MSYEKHVEEHIQLGLPINRDAVIRATYKPNTLIVIGDSITANCYSTDGSTFASYLARGYWTHAAVLLDQRLSLLANVAAPSETSAQIEARFDADVINNAAGKPGYVFILCGTNDTAATDTTANLLSMFNKAKAAGIQVLVGTIMPRQFTTIASSQTTLQHHMTTNAWLRLYCQEHAEVILVDFYEKMLDVSTVTKAAQGECIASYFADGIHPNATGARIMGTAIYEALNSIIPHIPNALGAGYDGTNGDAKNPILNPWFVTGTGGTLGTGFSGTIAQNWRTERSGANITGVCSKVARTDGIVGEWQRIALSGSLAANEYGVLVQYGTPDALTAAGIAAGDTVYGEMEVNIEATAGTLSRARLALVAQSVTPTTLFSSSDNLEVSSELNATLISGRFRTPPFVLPPTTAQCYLQLTAGTSIGGQANMDAARARIVKVG